MGRRVQNGDENLSQEIRTMSVKKTALNDTHQILCREGPLLTQEILEELDGDHGRITTAELFESLLKDRRFVADDTSRWHLRDIDKGDKSGVLP